MVVSLFGVQDIFESQRNLVKVNAAIGAIDADIPPAILKGVDDFFGRSR